MVIVLYMASGPMAIEILPVFTCAMTPAYVT